MSFADYKALVRTLDPEGYDGLLCDPGYVNYMTGIKGDKTPGIQLFNFGTEPVLFTETVVVGMTNINESDPPDF